MDGDNGPYRTLWKAVIRQAQQEAQGRKVFYRHEARVWLTAYRRTEGEDLREVCEMAGVDADWLIGRSRKGTFGDDRNS